MRIKSIYVKKYKNIREQTLVFPNNSSYVALIGLNNSGKSNWLEAVSLIFRDMYTGEKVGFKYEVVYDVDGKEYKLTSKSLKIDGKVAKKKTSIAPSNVIACYSGESLRLWRQAYEKYYMSFFAGVAKNEYSEPKMMYLNKYSWAICLIVLMCSEDEIVKRYLKEHLDVEELSCVNVEFEFNEQNIEKLKDNEVKAFLERIHQHGQAKTKCPMSMINTFDIGVAKNHEKCKRLFHILLLAAMPKQNEQISLDKSITKIGIDINGRLLEDISEGEKKLILITFITRILADKNSLLLLDEPDAHVHVANKVCMCDFFSSFGGQIVLTTHSPLFSDRLGNSNLRFIKDGSVEDVPRQKRVSVLSDGYITLVDGACLLTSKKVVVTEGHYDIAYIKKAIDLLKNDKPKYLELNRLCFISQGGAGHTKDFINDTIMPVIENLDKVLFLFDSDKDGKSAAKIVKDINDDKIIALCYLSNFKEPASDFYVEDYFGHTCYDNDVMEVVRRIGNATRYADIKKLSFSLGATVKGTIEKNYDKYPKEQYYNFRPLLDKLLDEFGLE